ncbi:hypothetical protein [Xanthomonas retroflexus]|uniref:hypothetical protein n=1 Tax=Stenotrophomonas indicatrix TaxID=2045451 RepID=UPI001481DD42
MAQAHGHRPGRQYVLHRALPEQGHHAILRRRTHFSHPVIAAEQGTGQRQMAGHRAHHLQRGLTRAAIAIRARKEQCRRLHSSRRRCTGFQAGEQAIIVGSPPTAPTLIKIEQPTWRQRLQPMHTIPPFIDERLQDLVDSGAQCGFGGLRMRYQHHLLPLRRMTIVPHVHGHGQHATVAQARTLAQNRDLVHVPGIPCRTVDALP